jgi:hypothetical protein
MFVIGVEHVISVVACREVGTYGAGERDDENLRQCWVAGWMGLDACRGPGAWWERMEVRRGLRILDTGS